MYWSLILSKKLNTRRIISQPVQCFRLRQKSNSSMKSLNLSNRKIDTNSPTTAWTSSPRAFRLILHQDTSTWFRKLLLPDILKFRTTWSPIRLQLLYLRWTLLLGRIIIPNLRFKRDLILDWSANIWIAIAFPSHHNQWANKAHLDCWPYLVN